MRRSVLFLVILAGSVFSQVKETCPRDMDVLITNARQELCPEPRLEYVALYCESMDSTIVLKGESSHAAVCDSILKRTSRLYSRVRNEMIVLPHPALGEKSYGVMRLSTGHLRRHADHDMEMISQGLLGETVQLLKRYGMFYFCKLSDGYLGWMEGFSVQEMNRQEYDSWQAAAKVIFMQGVGLIYSEKNTKSNPVSDIVAGCLVIKKKQEGGWIRVALPDGREGYLPKNQVMDYSEFSKQPQAGENELVKTAMSYLGHPYLWGGNSPKGYDCSGFTKTIYRLHGIELPRDANMQAQAGQPVELDSAYSHLKPGDLLFFGPKTERITHVGMYIGDRRFIHCDGMVRINSFNPKDENYSEYRVRGLRVAKRFLK